LEILEIKEAFDMFDLDGNGTVEKSEITEAMQKLGFADSNKQLFDLFMNEIDKDKSNNISFDEFL